jgi:hypothetical protein
MDLSTVVDLLSIIAVVSSLIFAGIELRHFRISRERESALELLSTYQSRDFLTGVRAITRLPDNQTKEQVEALTGDRMDEVYYVLASFEGLGALVYKGEISLALVEDFFAGVIVVTWSKLSRFAEDERKALGRETWVEWVQWLAERILEREKSKAAVPAYIEYKDKHPNS